MEIGMGADTRWAREGHADEPTSVCCRATATTVLSSAAYSRAYLRKDSRRLE